MINFRSALLVGILGLVSSTTARCAENEHDPLSSLEYPIAPEKTAALHAISPSAQNTIFPPRPPRSSPRLRKVYFHPLTPRDMEIRQSVRNLGTDSHRFVQCTLKDKHLNTGAIVSIGVGGFELRSEVFGQGRTILYRDLAVPPRPVAAVGAHLLNGLKITGMVALVLALAPLLIIPGIFPDC